MTRTIPHPRFPVAVVSWKPILVARKRGKNAFTMVAASAAKPINRIFSQSLRQCYYYWKIMDSHKNGVIHGRVLTVLNALSDISEAVTASDVISAQETRVEFLLSAIESSAAELHELFVGKMDEDNSKDSGNTSFGEVVCLNCCC